MRLTLVALGLVCMVSRAGGVAPYPSVLTVKYKDQMRPVLSVHDTNPVVLVDGKEKVIRSEPHYSVQRASGFADNYVEAPSGALGGPFRTRFLGGGGGPYSSMIDIEFPLTAKKTIKRGFAVVVVYVDLEASKEIQVKALGLNDQRSVMNDAFFSGTTIFVYELPELPAGKTIKTKFTAAVSVALLATDYFIQIFDDDGREVRTSGEEFAWRFYAHRERARLSGAMGKYFVKFKGADHDPFPATMPKPVFPPGAAMPAGEVVVTLTTAADGSDSHVEVPDVKDDGVRQSITDALGGWLFLPRLKQGVPGPTKIRVPLQF